MKRIFLEKLYTKCGRETTTRRFHRKSKLSITLDQESETLYSLFLLYAQLEVYQNIMKLMGVYMKASVKRDLIL